MALWPVRMLPSPLTYFVSNVFVDSSLFERGRHHPFNLRLSMCQTKLYQLNVKMLVAVDCRAVEIALEESDSLHPDAVGPLAARPVH